MPSLTMGGAKSRMPTKPYLAVQLRPPVAVGSAHGCALGKNGNHSLKKWEIPWCGHKKCRRQLSLRAGLCKPARAKPVCHQYDEKKQRKHGSGQHGNQPLLKGLANISDIEWIPLVAPIFKCGG